MKRILLGIMLLTALMMPLAWAGAPDIRLEGIVYDDQNPDGSIAIIDGQLHEKGRLNDRYEIVNIGPDFIEVLEVKSGEKFKVAVENAPQEKEPAPRKRNSVPSVGLMGRGWEMHALKDLALINNASVRYYERREFFPRKMKSLTLDGYLDASYENEVRGKYRFYLDDFTDPDHLGVHADPVEPASGLRFFYIGEDAVIRVSSGQPADKSSPKHDWV